MLKIKICALLLCIMAGGLYAAENERPATRRFGIFIGSNNGGRDRTMLRYAVSDAKSLSRIFSGMGGIADEDNILLVEPSVREINRQLDSLGKLAAQSRRNSQRTELVFYYSGHSDENGILLNRERYGYRELRNRIETVQSDMRIVILDSCSSGAITRAKGGVKTQPFLFDNSVSAEGYAILTSSSADEVSQESDSIESSYFTHSLMAGLRGAADSVGDGRVTLNELYRYAYTETLAKTETSLYGTQHPSYEIQISGSGDVVLTDIKEISASLLIADDLTGRISIRDSSDFLVAELTKITTKPMELGLEPGLYRITLQQGNNFYRTEIVLPENKQTTLGMGNFQMIAESVNGRSRGNDPANGSAGQNAEAADDVPLHSVNIQLMPGYNLIDGHGYTKATNNALIGIFVGMGHNLHGIGVAPIGLFNTGYVRGLQASGFFNYVHGSVYGIQASGTFNYTQGGVQGIQGTGTLNYAGGSVQGIQGSGVVNYSGGDVRGIQATGVANYAVGKVDGMQASGVFNYANEVQGAQAGLINVNRGGNGAMFGLVNISESEKTVPFGLVNIMKNGILHPAVYVDDMLFTNFSFRSGSKYFYSVMGFGFGGEALYGRSDDRFITGRVGFGVEYSVKKAFFDLDATWGNITNLSALGRTSITIDENSSDHENDYREIAEANSSTFQIRFTAGYKFAKHFGIFGGISYDHFYKYGGASPVPGDFGSPLPGNTAGNNVHKLGLFGGIQF